MAKLPFFSLFSKKSANTSLISESVENPNNERLIQSNPLPQLNKASKDIEALQSFSEELTPKTFYQKFKGLYKFSNYLLKYFLAFTLAALSLYGWFKIFHVNGFEGIVAKLFLFLAVFIAIGFAFTNEYLRQVFAKHFFVSLFRDRTVSKSSIIALVLCSVVALGTTAYGISQGIKDFSKIEPIEKSQSLVLAENQVKNIKVELAELKEKRAKKEVSKWYVMEQEPIIKSRLSTAQKELSIELKPYENEIKNAKIEASTGKEFFIYIGVIAGMLVDLFLIGILAWLVYFKVHSLKQIDIINNPITSLFNIQSNPLTTLSSNIQRVFTEHSQNPKILEASKNGVLPPNNYSTKNPHITQQNSSSKKQNSIGFKFGNPSKISTDDTKKKGEKEVTLSSSRNDTDMANDTPLSPSHHNKKGYNGYGRTDCDFCNKTFNKKSANSKYCSNSCKQKAYRKRNKSN